MSFAEKYGPWAVIAGASEGTGREFAKQVASQGVNCILIARRQGPLEELAAQIRSESGVDCVTASIDLARPDAYDSILEAVGTREIGLFISNAGADPNGSKFLDKDIQTWIDLINRNVLTSVRSCHHFGGLMRKRQRGGIILVGSAACYGSGPHLATYCGVKAFDLCFAEGLWSELKPHGVDVLYHVMITTDTPALRELLDSKGLPIPADVASPADVAAEGLARLAFGPVNNWGQADEDIGYATNSAAARRAGVEMVAQQSAMVFGEE